MALGELKNGTGPDAYAIYQQVLAAVVEQDHSVGSLYISENPTSPAELYGGAWERIEDCTIWGASDTHPAGTTVKAGLPSIFGQINDVLLGDNAQGSGALKITYAPVSYGNLPTGSGKAVSRSNIGWNDMGIYGTSDTVQPPAYCMYIWRRVA